MVFYTLDICILRDSRYKLDMLFLALCVKQQKFLAVDEIPQFLLLATASSIVRKRS
jgi:hypothetical protein